MLDETWRLLDLEAGDGAWNMAVDEALLMAATRGPALPTLRLYAWRRPCLSLGCIQPASDLDLAACERESLPIIRRASGGTAVLHEAALAYSLVLPLGHFLAPGDVVESYRRLGPPVLAALGRLGIEGRLVEPAEADRGGRGQGLGAVACFVGLAPFEVLVGGRKLVGNSQLRRRGAVLHHSMVPLDFDARRFASLLRTLDPAERSSLAGVLAARVGSARLALGESVAPDHVAEALRSGLAAALGVRLEPGKLTPEERSDAERLVVEKYGDSGWTFRR